ncbi:MAG: hypothetical protein K0Q74_1238 [Gammaproteobacteria bacterium]|jgi:hypothetical protein|nr:hypothetical protein [Gammaproteobacteria bacterium]
MCMLRFFLDCRVAVAPRKDGGRILTVCANLGKDVTYYNFPTQSKGRKAN